MYKKFEIYKERMSTVDKDKLQKKNIELTIDVEDVEIEDTESYIRLNGVTSSGCCQTATGDGKMHG